MSTMATTADLLGCIPISSFWSRKSVSDHFWNANNAVIGLLYSPINIAVFQVFLKLLIGSLRPHFLDVCDLDPALIAFCQDTAIDAVILIQITQPR